MPAKPKPSTPKAKPTSKPKPATTKSTSSKTTKPFDYQVLLQRARSQVPPEAYERPRFTIPKVSAFIQGPRTVIRNFKEITDTLRRDPRHLIRFLARELATAGEMRGRQAIFNGRFNTRALDELVERYTKEYVLCPICNGPDTDMKREERLLVLVCSGCGGRTPLRSI
ncbi:MAG: translation initiation factor IF-2 subunit beta [Promethearchaeota archaeon]